MRSRSGHGLVASCDDPRLLDFPLWPRQRELLASIEHGPRLHVVAMGRRSGKTTTGALLALWDALLRPELDTKVRPGERRYAVAVAVNLRQARVFVAAARSIVERSPLLAPLLVSASDDELVFANGAAIAGFPCTARGGRGWPISCLLLDEFAHHVDGEGNSAAESVWRALSPSVAQFGDSGRVVVCSTPWGSDGLFASLYAQAANGELPDARAHHATTQDANPTIDAAFLAAERARSPEAFAAEYGAQFVGSGGSFLDAETIAEAVTLPRALRPDEGTEWICGLDPAFSQDSFGVAIVGRDLRDRGRLVLGYAAAIKPTRSESFEERRGVEDATLAQVAAICARYGVRRAVTDQFAGAAVVERLRRYGLQVTTHPMTAATKTDAYVELRDRLVNRTLSLYPHDDLLAELRRLRSRFSAGRASVVSPRVGGSHGDLAQSLAIALGELRYEPLSASSGWVGGDVFADAFRGADDDSGRLDSGIHPGMAF